MPGTDGIVVEVAAVAEGAVVDGIGVVAETVLTGTLVAGAVVDGIGVVAETVLTGTLVAGAVVDEPASSGTEPTARVV